MSNNLAFLNQRVTTALRDESYNVWDAEEIDDLVKWSVAELWPRYSRELDPTATTITLVASTYYYAIPSGCYAISRLDWVDTNANEMGPMVPGSWEVVGDPEAGTQKVHIAPVIVQEGGTIRVLGYGKYDTTTNLIPDNLVHLVVARARAEALRRVAATRARYEQWAASNHATDTTVGDLLNLIKDADREADLLRTQRKTWQRPVPARHG